MASRARSSFVADRASTSPSAVRTIAPPRPTRRSAWTSTCSMPPSSAASVVDGAADEVEVVGVHEDVDALALHEAAQGAADDVEDALGLRVDRAGHDLLGQLERKLDRARARPGRRASPRSAASASTAACSACTAGASCACAIGLRGRGALGVAGGEALGAGRPRGSRRPRRAPPRRRRGGRRRRGTSAAGSSWSRTKVCGIRASGPRRRRRA